MLKGPAHSKNVIFLSTVRAGPHCVTVVFWKLFLNGDTKTGCIRLVWAGAKKYKFSFLLCAGPLSLIKQSIC